MILTPAESSLFFSKNDPEDPRMGEAARRVDIHSLKTPASTRPDVSITGYADDEGIALNGGRTGAAQAPEAIRRFLYKMTPALFSLINPVIYDLGNIDGKAGSLKEKHDLAYQTQFKALEKGLLPVSVGGGHDYGFSDFAAFCDHAVSQGKKPVVVNLDAHLDVRPNADGNHSGTPFFRLLQEYGKELTLFEFGLQEWCNSKAHYQWARAQGAHLFTVEECINSGMSVGSFILKRLQPHMGPQFSLGVSLDMDVLSSAFAPAASQVFPVGFEVREFMGLWDLLAGLPHLKQVGIYEVSPPFDHDSMSSKFAAILIHKLIFRRVNS